MIIKPGTIECLINNNKENTLYHSPVLQLINVKRIDLGEDKGCRYHVILSDSHYYMKGVFSSSCTKHFEQKLINNLSLVKLGAFRVCEKNGTTFLYIAEIEEFEDCNKKMGNPVKYNDAESSYFESPKPSNSVKKQEKNLKNEEKIKSSVEGKQNITPIITLNPFLNKWIIQGTLTSKGDIRYYTNQKGDGKLFNAEVTDHSGSIRIVAFGEAVDIFYNLLNVGKVYSVSRGNIRVSNKKFSNSSSDYEILLDKNSEIKMVAEASPNELHYKFIKINEINMPQALVDLICVVKEAYPCNSVTVRNTGKEVIKRDLIVCDPTGSIRLTLWGQQAEADFDENPILAIKDAKVGEYRGFTINTIPSSQVIINPERKEAYELKGWFLKHGNEIQLPKRDDIIKTINDAVENSTDFTSVKAMIMFIKDDNLWYDSCKGEGCNKKVFLEGNLYHCDRCNKDYEDCNTRYLVRASIGDHTGQIWVTLFDDQAQKLFEKSASEMKTISQDEGLENVVKMYFFKEFIFRLRRKEEIYNDEARSRYTVMDISPVDIKKEALRILSDIRKTISLK